MGPTGFSNQSALVSSSKINARFAHSESKQLLKSNLSKGLTEALTWVDKLEQDSQIRLLPLIGVSIEESV